MMNILMMLSNPFVRDPRVHAEAQALKNAGHDVTILAQDTEGGHPQQEDSNGVHIVRLKAKFAFTESWWFRIISAGRNKTLLALLFLPYFLLLQWQLCRTATDLHMVTPFDVIHSHDADTLLASVYFKRKTRLPLVYDAHEVYSYMMSRHFPRRIADLFWVFEKILLRYVDRIITVHEGLAQRYREATDKPVATVLNCKPLQGWDYEQAHNDLLTILYIGVLHAGRAVPLLIEAVKGLPDVRCIVGGVGQPDYIKGIEKACNTTPNAEFVGAVPPEQAIPMTRSADVVFMMVNPSDRNNCIGLGNKQFEAMVCGRPIICTKGTYSGALTEHAGTGLVVEYSVEALRQAIMRLRDDRELCEQLGCTALECAKTEYNWEKQEKVLLSVYASLTWPNHFAKRAEELANMSGRKSR